MPGRKVGFKVSEESKLRHSIRMKELYASGLNFRKGKKHSEETKEKMSERKKQNPSRYWLNKKREESGEKHYNWKGGITNINTAIRNSTEYKKWRKSVFERDNYTCVFCGQVGGHLNVDHIKAFSKFPDLRLDINNGRTLCISCHKQTDTYCKKALNLTTYDIHST
jgi:predicted restriction endonuclease